jgi:zinc protease
LEDAEDHYRRYYCPNNAFIIVVGDFEKERVITRIRETFGPISRGPSPSFDNYEDPPQKGERTVQLVRDAELPFMAMGYHVPGIGHEDSFALEAVAAILSGGKSSRLYKNIVRRGLAVSAEADHSLITFDPGLFIITAKALPGKNLSELQQALEKELDRLRIRKVGARELEKALNVLESAFLFSQDSIFMQALAVGRFEVASSWTDVDNYIPRLRSVTAEDVQKAVRRYLVAQNRTVGFLLPTEDEEKDPKRMSGRLE